LPEYRLQTIYNYLPLRLAACRYVGGELLRLTARDAQRIPFPRGLDCQMLRQKENLSDVMGVVRHLPVDSLVLATQKGAVLIPNQATQISQKGPFVYVVKPDNTADLRLVTLGQRQGDNVVITQGVAAGEIVIVAGQMTVLPNSKVRVDTAGAGPAGSTPAGAPTSTK
jgi:hypothetical protein